MMPHGGIMYIRTHQQRLTRQGIMKDIYKRRWSSEEDREIINRYVIDGPYHLAELLDRSPHAVMNRVSELRQAGAKIGKPPNRKKEFAKKRYKPWTTHDIRYLINYYYADGPEGIAMALERTRGAVVAKAVHLRKDGIILNGSARI